MTNNPIPESFEHIIKDSAFDICLYCHKMDDKEGSCTANPQPCEASIRTAKEIFQKAVDYYQPLLDAQKAEIKLQEGLFQDLVQEYNVLKEDLAGERALSNNRKITILECIKAIDARDKEIKELKEKQCVGLSLCKPYEKEEAKRFRAIHDNRP